MELLPVEMISPTSIKCLWPGGSLWLHIQQGPPRPWPQPLPEMQEQSPQRRLIISLPDFEH